ncbi:hypothetical protein ACWA2C_26365 [Priestia megaterium]
MKIDGSTIDIKNKFRHIIKESTPKMLSENYLTDFPVIHCIVDENETKDNYHILISIFFTETPTYMYGIVNIDENKGSLSIINNYVFEDVLFDITDMVIRNFKFSSYKHQRKIISHLGREMYNHLKEFNGESQIITNEISEDIYSNLIDIDIIEEYMDFF